ncbi:response regulator, partial [Vibrio parahaemolyticus V-223/04]
QMQSQKRMSLSSIWYC